jgi:hypothetical protein
MALSRYRECHQIVSCLIIKDVIIFKKGGNALCSAVLSALQVRVIAMHQSAFNGATRSTSRFNPPEKLSHNQQQHEQQRISMQNI